MTSVPMSSPSTTIPVDPPVIQTPLDRLPEMTSRAPAVVPPTVSLDEPEKDTPLPPFPRLEVPEALVPIKSPRIKLSLVAGRERHAVVRC